MKIVNNKIVEINYPEDRLKLREMLDNTKDVVCEFSLETMIDLLDIVLAYSPPYDSIQIENGKITNAQSIIEEV